MVLLAVGGIAVVIERRDKPPDDAHHVGRTVANRATMDLAAILRIAATHVPGEVLKVELEPEDGRVIYEITVLAENGRVREIELDANDGTLIKIEDD